MGASSFLSAEASELLAAPSKSAMIFYGLSMIGSLFTSAYTVMGIVLQYYSLKEKKEGTSLMDRIDQIGSDDSMGFDNEGEY
jgi:ABC-type transport system involved in cytochrome c biogenesis permease subunit